MIMTLTIVSLLAIGYPTLLVLMGVVLVMFIMLIGLQRRQSRQLKSELEQLDKLNDRNVEAEFVLKAMHLATWHLDARTRMLSVDMDFRDKSSWVAPLDGASDSKLISFLYPPDVDVVTKTMNDLCEGRIEEYHMEYRVVIPHTDKFYWEESYATVVERDVESKPLSIVGTTKRVDDRKRMEQELIDARVRAEESDRMKSAFISNMSHEIRTPLNAIVGFTSVLPSVTSDEERSGLLTMIHDNTQKLLYIIEDVVSISRLESGQEKLMLTEFDLNMVMMEYVELIRKELNPSVEISTHFAFEKQQITSDINRLGLILKHLLSNAVKFTKQGIIVVGYEKPADGKVSIWVRDTGIGIAEEYQKRVFERFFKVNEFVPGAGLGLFICQAMAASLGGTISLESKPDQGTKVTVTIPIR